MSDPASDPAASPPFSCDLILKGGITSGVVYPPAIVEIARDHRLRSVGGASAGAIGAASAAAAELGRRSATGGFALLAELPAELAVTDASGRTLLRRLFQPQPETADVFDIVWHLRTAKGSQKLRGAVAKLEQHGAADRQIVIGGACALAIAVMLAGAAAMVAGPGSLIGSIPLILLVAAVWWIALRAGRVYAGVTSLARNAPARIAENFHGICNGSSRAGGSSDDGSAVPALTDWLHTKLQALAGRNDPGLSPEQRSAIVTYGELRGAGIELTTITTDLTHGTSERFPLQTRGWAFKRSELARLFPPDVVEHLVAHGVAPTDPVRVAALAGAGLHPLPSPDLLPILLGARISLSFPLLLSAVPLYMDAGGERRPLVDELREELVLRWRHHVQPPRSSLRPPAPHPAHLRDQPRRWRGRGRRAVRQRVAADHRAAGCAAGERQHRLDRAVHVRRVRHHAELGRQLAQSRSRSA